MPALPTQIDAVLIPPGYVTATDPYGEMAQLATEFAPLLRVNKLIKRSLLDGRDFLPKSLEDTFLFPTGHAREGQPRYEWADRGDGVQYGTLIKES